MFITLAEGKSGCREDSEVFQVTRRAGFRPQPGRNDGKYHNNYGERPTGNPSGR